MNKVLLVILCILFSFPLFAQNEDGIRDYDFIPDEPYMPVFHTGIPIIRSIPPLSISMPCDVLLGYIVMDSIGRFYNDSAFRAVRGKSLEQSLEDLQASNDTLQTIWKYLYKMIDYDPLRYHQYLIEQDLMNSLYSFKSTYKDFTWLYKSYDLNLTIKKRIASALIPDYILKVQVVKIDSMKAPYSSFGDTSSYDFFKISCIVLDTIKGKVIPMDTISIQTNKQEEEIKSVSYRFNFIVTKNSYFQVRMLEKYNHPFPNVDSLIFDTSRKIMRVHHGQELLISLQLFNAFWTKTHDFFQFCVVPKDCQGVFPIVNGMVSDVNKIWSDSTWIPYETFKQRYNETVDIILNKRY